MPSHRLALGPTSRLLLLAGVLWPLISGCATVYSTYRLPPAEVEYPGEEDIRGITTMAGEQIRFDTGRRPRARRPVIDGDSIRTFVNRQPYEITLAEVRELWVSRRNENLTRLVRWGSLAIGVAVVYFAIESLKDWSLGSMNFGGGGASDGQAIPPGDSQR